MIYLKKFETQSAYEAAQSGLILPNVSLTVDNNTVHYNPSTPTPTQATIVAVLNVYTISEASDIIATEEGIALVDTIKIDGVELPSVVSAYTFSTTGEHTIEYTLVDQTTIGWGIVPYDVISVTISDSVTSIGESAFNGGLIRSVTIGSSVTNIGDTAFYNLNNLASFTINATTPPTIGSDNFYGEMSIPTIYVPSGSLDTYKAASGWSDYAEFIEPIQ